MVRRVGVMVAAAALAAATTVSVTAGPSDAGLSSVQAHGPVSFAPPQRAEEKVVSLHKFCVMYKMKNSPIGCVFGRAAAEGNPKKKYQMRVNWPSKRHRFSGTIFSIDDTPCTDLVISAWGVDGENEHGKTNAFKLYVRTAADGRRQRVWGMGDKVETFPVSMSDGFLRLRTRVVDRHVDPMGGPFDHLVYMTGWAICPSS